MVNDCCSFLILNPEYSVFITCYYQNCKLMAILPRFSHFLATKIYNLNQQQQFLRERTILCIVLPLKSTSRNNKRKLCIYVIPWNDSFLTFASLVVLSYQLLTLCSNSKFAFIEFTQLSLLLLFQHLQHSDPTQPANTQSSTQYYVIKRKPRLGKDTLLHIPGTVLC